MKEKNAPLARLAAFAVSQMNRAGLSRVVQARVVRQIAKRLVIRHHPSPQVKTIISGLGRGLQLQFLPTTPTEYWFGTHEPWMQDAINREIQPGWVVYDCGANIGYYAAIFASAVGETGKVFAFEPSPASYKCLEIAGSLNGFRNIVPVEAATWDKSEKLRLMIDAPGKSHVSDHIRGALGSAKKYDGAMVDVPAISLDDFVFESGNPPPDLIKIDVEGAEGKTLEGAMRVLQEYRPRLLLEIHGEPGHDVWRILKTVGYKVVNLNTGVVPESSDEFAVWISQYLAIPA